jgi:HD domain
VGKLSRIAWIYIGAVIAAAAIAVARGPFTGIRWDQVAALGLLLIACESTATLLRSRSLAWSANSTASLAAVILVGPVGAALVGCCTVFGMRRGPSLAQRLFNTGMFTLSAYLAGRAYLLVGGHVGTPTPKTFSFPDIIGPFACALVVHVLVNFSLLRGVLWLTREPGTALGRVGLDFKLLLMDMGYAAFGVLIAALWGVLGPFTPVLVVIPLLVARWAVTQFAAQQRAYESTVSALCQAVETKDFYTRGHSERVSRGSVMISREIGMRVERVEAIRYAGMLHDVGKLGVPTSVLQKNGSLTDDEYAAIQLHPMRGLDIVREIGFLDEALAGIMHHHERIDGRGYPMGLAGDEIPEFARVLAVADAFDAMTSTRSYRGARPVPEAVAELRKWAGTQFDPAFVDAFIAAIERDGWKAPVSAPAGSDQAAVSDALSADGLPGALLSGNGHPIAAGPAGTAGTAATVGMAGTVPKPAGDLDDPTGPLRAIESL